MTTRRRPKRPPRVPEGQFDAILALEEAGLDRLVRSTIQARRRVVVQWAVVEGVRMAMYQEIGDALAKAAHAHRHADKQLAEAIEAWDRNRREW